MDIKLANWMSVVESEDYVLTTKDKDEIFKRGAVVSVKHPKIFEPVLTVIQKIEGEELIFRIPDDFLRSNVFKGDTVSCHVMQGEYEYIVDGKITRFDITYPRLVHLLIEKTRRVKNNRKNKRYLVNFQSFFTPYGVDKKIYAIIKNVSLSGICAVFREEVEVESLVNVFVSASIEKSMALEFKAKVNRVIEREFYNEYGLEIVDIDDINKDMLDRLIYRLECDESEFVSKCLK
mgnify:CR=1 FL=1